MTWIFFFIPPSLSPCIYITHTPLIPGKGWGGRTFLFWDLASIFNAVMLYIDNHMLWSHVGSSRENILGALGKDALGDSFSSTQIRNEISNKQNNPQRRSLWDQCMSSSGPAPCGHMSHLPWQGSIQRQAQVLSEGHPPAPVKSETVPIANTYCYFTYHKERKDAAGATTQLCFILSPIVCTLIAEMLNCGGGGYRGI